MSGRLTPAKHTAQADGTSILQFGPFHHPFHLCFGVRSYKSFARWQAHHRVIFPGEMATLIDFDLYLAMFNTFCHDFDIIRGRRITVSEFSAQQLPNYVEVIQ